mgnify:CR=1 FL=1
MPDLIVASDNLVLTPHGFMEIEELSIDDQMLESRLSGGLEWKKAGFRRVSGRKTGVRLITDRNEITIEKNVLLRVIRDDRMVSVKADKVQMNDQLDMVFPGKQVNEVKPHPGTRRLDQNFSYLLGVMNNMVKSADGRAVIKIWGYPEDSPEFGQELVRRFLKVTGACDYGSVAFEEGARYSWWILPFQESTLTKSVGEFASYLSQGAVPPAIRLGTQDSIVAYIAGIVDTNIQYDDRTKSFFLSLPNSKSRLRRFLLDYFSLIRIHGMLTKVIYPNCPFETQTYVDMSELVRGCNMPFARTLCLESADEAPGDILNQTTVLPRIRSKVKRSIDHAWVIHSEPFWQPVISWLPLR